LFSNLRTMATIAAKAANRTEWSAIQTMILII
jgi:hypothetical protein